MSFPSSGSRVDSRPPLRKEAPVPRGCGAGASSWWCIGLRVMQRVMQTGCRVLLAGSRPECDSGGHRDGLELDDQHRARLGKPGDRRRLRPPCRRTTGQRRPPNRISPMSVRVLLSVALLSTGCASLPTGPGYTRPGLLLGDLPAVAGSRSIAQNAGDRRPGASASSLEGPSGGGPQNAALTRQAVLGAVDQVQVSMAATTSALSRLSARTTGIGGANGAFFRHLVHGSSQLPWLQDALASSRALADATVGVGDADMELAILRMAGPRAQAAMF